MAEHGSVVHRVGRGVNEPAKCIAAYSYRDGTASLHFSSGATLATTREIKPQDFVGATYSECLRLLDDMNTCKTCRWYVEKDGNLKYRNVKVCTCPKVIFAVTKWGDGDSDDGDLLVSKKDGHVISGDEAAVVDGSDYAGWLMPCPDFGCVHHEPRGEQT